MQLQIIYILILFFLVGCVSTKPYAKYDNPNDLYPIGIEGYWGYVDSLGNERIPMTFEETKLFAHGLAAAKYDGKYGYIDSTGKWVIKPKFDKAGDFYFGCAEVVLNGEQKYIRRNGKTNSNCELWHFIPGCIVPYPPADPSDYSVIEDEKIALLYKSLNDTTEYIYDSTRKFSHDFILVSQNDKWGFHYIHNNRPNYDGVPLRELIYDDVKTTYYLWNNEVDNGSIMYAEVKKSDRWGLLNAYSLNEIIPPQYYSMDREINKNYILVEFRPDSFGYIDYQGHEYFRR
jgi:hypothetical protein